MMGAAWARQARDLMRRNRRLLEASVLRRNPGPRWHTAHEVLAEHPAWRLRDFSGPNAARRARRREDGSRHPVLIVPPEVNRSTIVDFGPGQSLVQAVLDAGFPRVAVLDWRSATARTAR